MAGVEGLEPTTKRLTVFCATTAPHPNRLKLDNVIISIALFVHRPDLPIKTPKLLILRIFDYFTQVKI